MRTETIRETISEAITCWRCGHDVNEHDERARCGSSACGCGW
jgi:hypothetical protein